MGGAGGCGVVKGLCTTLAVCAWLFTGCTGDERPNVVLVILDTTRADHFSAYGYPRATTPGFDAFAERAILFERAFATSSRTVPSHASLFTGLYPMTHGATQESQYLSEEAETLAELLAADGYETAAFSNNAWVGEKTNLTQGFGYVGEMWRERGHGQAMRTNRAVMEWLDARARDRPFFLFVNYIEPHWPYSAPRAWQDRFLGPGVTPAQRKRANFGVVDWYLDRSRVPDGLLPIRTALYDAELAWVDSALGELLELLRNRGLEDSSLVVVASDHGENLGDNDHQGHSFALYDSTLRIPLAIRPPGGGGAGSLRRDPVQLTDVFHTIASAAGVAPGDTRSVGEDLLAGPLPDERPVVAEYYYPAQFLSYFPEPAREGPGLAPFRRRIRSLRVGPHKFIWGSDGRHELYDVEADPGETRDLAASAPAVAGRMQEALEILVERYGADTAPPAPRDGVLDPETEATLRELGYLR